MHYLDALKGKNYEIAWEALSSQNVLIPFYQMPQETSYYCGPATASELVDAKTFNLVAQSTLAGPLHEI